MYSYLYSYLLSALKKLLSDITVKYFKELSMYEHAKPYFVTFDDYQDVTRQLHRQGNPSNTDKVTLATQVTLATLITLATKTR